jgi:hypothetical protein
MDIENVDYSDGEFFEEFFMPLISGAAFDSSSSGDNVDPWVSHPRTRLPGGAGTGRMDRAAPRPYLPSINCGPATRRHLEWMANGVACISTHKRHPVLVIEHEKISVTNSDCLFRCSTGYYDAHWRTVGSPLIRIQVEGTIRPPCA